MSHQMCGGLFGGFFKKLTALVLIFCFVLPSSVVFAQTAGTGTNSGDSASDTADQSDHDNGQGIPADQPDIDSPDSNETTLPADDADTASDDDVTDEDLQQDEPANEELVPEEPAPESLLEPLDLSYKNEFESKNPFRVQNTSGALIFDVPLTIPPGRNGVQPKLSLTYSSDNRNVGIFGKGWEISIPYISRKNTYGSDHLYASSTFFSSMSGNLATSSVAGVYYAESDGGENLKYEFVNNAWFVSDKNGWVYKFGSTTAARQDDPNDTSRVYKWLLEEIRDPNGNYVSFEYFKEDGQIYPDVINYTGNGGTDGVFEIEFVRESRADVGTLYYPNFGVKTAYRVKEIEVRANGSLVRKYSISYTTTDNSNTSIIDQITESGTDESSVVTTLAPYDFDYQRTKDDFEENNALESPVNFRYGNIDFQIRIADVNGDGLQDLLKSYLGPEQATTTVYIHHGSSGWGADYSWEIPVDFAKNYTDLGVRVLDINNDGYADIVQSYDGGDSGFNHSRVFLNKATTSGWTLDPSWVVPELFNYNNYNLGVEIVDINGDNLPDIVKSSESGQLENGTRVYINTGHSWVRDTSWNFPETFVFNHVDVGVRLVDINGDNLTDILKSYDAVDYSGNKIYINNGNGWNLSSSTVPVTFGTRIADLGVRFADMNGDGLTDLVKSYDGSDGYGYTDNAVYINTGENSWTEDTTWVIPEEFGYQKYDLGVRVFDANGDNLPDIVKSLDAFPPSSSFNGTKTYINKGQVGDLLNSAKNPSDGKTTVSYLGSAQYEDSGILNPDLPYILQTVQEIGYNDGINSTATTTYQYIGGDLYFANPQDNQVAGFNQVVKTDPVGNVTKTYFHQGNNSQSGDGEYQDNKAKIGNVYRVERYDDDDNLYEKLINKWVSIDREGNTNFALLKQSVDSIYDGDNDHKDRAVSYEYDASNGNLTEQTEWGEVTGSDNGTFSDAGTDLFVTSVTYATSSPMFLTSKETVIDQSSNKVREQKIYYDNQSLGSVVKGNPTKVEQWVTGASYIDTEKTYNNFGLVTQEKDPRDKTTSYEYDSFNLYPATTTNPLSQKTVYAYDYSAGKPKQVKDPNGFVFQTVYDGLDRVKEEKQPDLTTPSTLVTKSEYSYVDTGSLPRLIHKKDYLNAATSTDSYTYVDGFGRVIQQRNEAEGSNTFSVVDTKYNSIGKVLKQSLPYFSTGASSTAPTATNSLYVSYTYDPLFRVETIINALGETTNTYDDWKLTITDPNDNDKNLYRDAYGNLVQVDEIEGANTYVTEYKYDGNKNLKKIIDALDNVRNFTYDGLGRLLASQDLHAPADNNYGTWTYSYDAAGNLATSTDPKSQVVTYTYDDLNRPTAENYTGAAGTEVTYTYDSCNSGVGRLCSATFSDVTVENQYNALGLVKTETKTVDTQAYPTTYTYDRQGNVTKITHPDNSVTENAYNSAGQLEKVAWKKTGVSAESPIIQDLNYSPIGHVSYMKYGNNASTTNTYDATAMYRLAHKVTWANNKFQDLAYTYDPVGNITKIIDTSNTNSAKTVDYGYDDLYRLTSASSTNAATTNYNETYAYNAIGNLISKSDVGEYFYEGYGSTFANPHAATSILSPQWEQEMSYDNNGNLLSYITQTNTWNYKNWLTQTGNGTATTSALYDYTGDRVKRTDSSGATVYPNKLYDITGSSTASHHVYAGDTLVATIQTTITDPGGGGDEEEGQEEPPAEEDSIVIHYVHPDHLGSTAVVTTQNGDLEELTDYYPYGNVRLDERNTDFKETNKYTGHEYDEDSELTYMGARYQDGKIGRFLSVDPAYLAVGTPDLKQKTKMELEQYLADPQGLNSYSYARGNPMGYRDESGNFSFWFENFANSRQEFSSDQVESIGYNKLPYYYRQAGDPSGTLRINDQKIQELGTLAANLALMFAGSESNVSGLLRESEGLGGHAIERHTGKTIGDLGGRFGTNFSGQYSSAFYSEAVGDVATYSNIQNNLGKIKTWLNGGSKNPLNLTSTLDINVGFGIDRSGQVYNGIKDIRTVLQKTGNANGYIIKTSFPKVRRVRR